MRRKLTCTDRRGNTHEIAERTESQVYRGIWRYHRAIPQEFEYIPESQFIDENNGAIYATFWDNRPLTGRKHPEEIVLMIASEEDYADEIGG